MFGFYRGLLPSLLSVSHGAVQFMLYEEFKIARRHRLKDRSQPLHTVDIIFLSSLSKLMASSATYPLQVIRSRLQNFGASSFYAGLFSVVAQTWRREGIPGFYKGLVPNLARVVPSTCMTFVVYENTKTLLQTSREAQGESSFSSDEVDDPAKAGRKPRGYG